MRQSWLNAFVTIIADGSMCIANAHSSAKRSGRAQARCRAYYTDFQNEYLDDSGWWAVAWLKFYERTHDAKYLATAKNIHAHMAKNWRPDKGGGVLWCEDEDKQQINDAPNFAGHPTRFGNASRRGFRRNLLRYDSSGVAIDLLRMERAAAAAGVINGKKLASFRLRCSATWETSFMVRQNSACGAGIRRR